VWVIQSPGLDDAGEDLRKALTCPPRFCLMSVIMKEMLTRRIRLNTTDLLGKVKVVEDALIPERD
jgi:hypothetical protein